MFWLLYFIWFLLVFPFAAEGFPLPASRGFFRPRTIAMIYISALAFTRPVLFGGTPLLPSTSRTPSSTRKPATYRTRRSIWSIMEELGVYGTRRAYRMKRDSFFALFRVLVPHMKGSKGSRKKSGTGPTRRERKYDGATNGIIPKTSRLSMALRWFAGGSVWDIVLVHGVSVSACSSLRLQFPQTHEKQQEAAREFYKISKAGFETCVGALYGVLIWTERPTEEDCRIAKFSGTESPDFGSKVPLKFESRMPLRLGTLSVGLSLIARVSHKVQLTRFMSGCQILVA